MKICPKCFVFRFILIVDHTMLKNLEEAMILPNITISVNQTIPNMFIKFIEAV